MVDELDRGISGTRHSQMDGMAGMSPVVFRASRNLCSPSFVPSSHADAFRMDTLD